MANRIRTELQTSPAVPNFRKTCRIDCIVARLNLRALLPQDPRPATCWMASASGGQFPNRPWITGDQLQQPTRQIGMSETYSDRFLMDILEEVTTFACVGVSGNPIRPSYFVARFLSLRGYSIIPVNPNYVGKRLFGSEVRADLGGISVDTQVDVVDIFRRSEEVPSIVEQALDRFPSLKVIWMQVGVANQYAATLARDAGVNVIQNRCPKIEHQRLYGELRMAGINTGIVSSKLQ